MAVVMMRELKYLFMNIKAVVCLAVYTALSGVLLVINNLSTGYSEVLPVLSAMTLLSAALMPLVSADIFGRERRAGSGELLLSMPQTSASLVLGKLFAQLLFFAIPVGVAAFYPLSLSLLGAQSIGYAFFALLMLLLFQLFIISLCALISARLRKRWAAYLTVYLILAGSFLLGSLSFVFPAGMQKYVKLLSPFRYYDSAVYGFFDISSAVFYITFATLFIFLTVRFARSALQKHASPKKKGFDVRRTLVASALCCLCVLTSIGGALLPISATRLDVSSQRLYAVSNSSKEYLSELDEEITVYLFNPTGEEKLGNYIERYCSLSNNLKLKKVFVSGEHELLDRFGLSTDSLAYYTMVFESGKRWRLVSPENCFKYYHPELGYMTPSEYQSVYKTYYTYYQMGASGMGGSSEDLSNLAQMLQSLETDTKEHLCAEEAMTEAVAYVTAEYVPTVYFASGSGEKNANVSTLDLTDGSNVPQNASLIIINAPDKDYSDEHIAKLLAFTEGGGRVVMLINEANLAMPNLMRLAACYGMTPAAQSGESGNAVTVNVGTEVALSSSSGLKKLTLEGACPIKTTETDGITLASLLTASVAGENEDETVTHSYAVAAYKGSSPCFTLISGADSFNKDATTLRDDEEAADAYVSAMTFLRSVTSGMRKSFSSSLLYPEPKSYNPAVLSVDAGKATLYGTLFIALIPTALLLLPLLRRYLRKRRTAQATE